METLYAKTQEKDIAKYVLFSGDPWRVETVAGQLEDVKHIAFAREFNTYTGYYKGVRITVTSTGIGAPSAAIAMEEMYQCGMEVAVRMGTTMGLKDDLLGKLIIPTGSMREEATSKTYVPVSYPAVADFDLINCMNKSTLQNNRQYVNGLSCTLDGFYSQMRDSRLSEKMQRDMSETFTALKKYNISAVDMESSCMLVLANLMGIKACIVTMTTVLENLKDFLKGDARTQSEVDLCKIAMDGLVIYHEEVASK
ncbi:nucleoside phosphorylase [Ruminiclostridium cellulolyticum]|uniref:Uridine phosphorylase n=1 Tax=Ruminiclostridium cellulolyticum (strain ATCC 35319 / DSM 5812 / JCM 6584 / H10) TaxID=394503 RepID=B8HZU0_RUMCH|nr:nucleoside phosphorylase [Ruminiclostridium cellulolyticum]ACL75440.1 purine or other phosphorylase family 1 [Ruminiclostridium cellulolyticum H10]